MAEPSGRIDCGSTDSIRLIHESVQMEEIVLDVLIRNGCRNEDLKKVSSLLSMIYGYGFEVGKRCVKE
nr:MAG: hypothetical protein [Bacteriophage sp.]